MKVSLDVDCTPEEARRFLGFPDVTPVHDAYVEKLRQAVSDGFGPEAALETLKQWGPMSEAGLGFWQRMFEQMSKAR